MHDRRRRGREGGRERECELSDGGVDVSIDQETDFEASFGVGSKGDRSFGGGGRKREKLKKGGRRVLTESGG